jgi:hypothetical protein
LRGSMALEEQKYRRAASPIRQDFRFTLTYSGMDKLYTLSEYQWAGDDWFKISESRWANIDAPIEEIRKRTEDKAREARLDRV